MCSEERRTQSLVASTPTTAHAHADVTPMCRADDVSALTNIQTYSDVRATTNAPAYPNVTGPVASDPYRQSDVTGTVASDPYRQSDVTGTADSAPCRQSDVTGTADSVPYKKSDVTATAGSAPYRQPYADVSTPSDVTAYPDVSAPYREACAEFAFGVTPSQAFQNLREQLQQQQQQQQQQQAALRPWACDAQAQTDVMSDLMLEKAFVDSFISNIGT